MEKKQFKAESRRLLDLMINSIYTHKEIFLRELISNSSDAIDKIYYKALSDENMTFDKDKYYIQLTIDKNNRLIIIEDTGIGMTKNELEENLGTIAKSGSLAFKKENAMKDGVDIIGQFGVGFYSAFMVADNVIVESKSLFDDKAYTWESNGIDGYTITESSRTEPGTKIILKVKENADGEDFDNYLEEYTIKNIIKKYSDFIRYPIKMQVTSSVLKEGTDDEYEEQKELRTVNSMIPIWKKRKGELKEEDYSQFYKEKHFGFDEPLKAIHTSADGAVSYNAILYIPERVPYDFYTKEYKRGLELYSNGVMIMSKCEELLPDYFSFIKGVVDSEDLSLNISRELLQHDRQLKIIAKNLKTKIKKELLKMMRNDRVNYEKFYESFGKILKYGVYSDFGVNKEDLKDLLLFKSSKEQKYVSLKEYIGGMKEEQKYIYYAAGDKVESINKLPQTEFLLDNGFEILYFTDEIDEFAIRVLMSYEEKEFKSVSSNDIGVDEEKKKEIDKVNVDNKEMFEEMKNILSSKVKQVRASERLKKCPICLSNDGEISIEMEKILSQMPEGNEAKAEKILEINPNHNIFKTLLKVREEDKRKFEIYTKILFNQAQLIEGLAVEDPIELTNNICDIIA